jgi:DNA-directed RNA polymerase specialized sigma24 family protein
MLVFCDIINEVKKVLDIELEKHYPTWRRFARGLTRDTVKGDDLLAETLLKILENQREKAEALADEGKLFYYVNRALYLMHIDPSGRFGVKYGKFSRNWETLSEKHLLEPVTPWLGSRLDNEYIDAYINLMPQLDAVVLRLYMLDDFSYKDASKATGIPVKQLYKLVENAITKIKKNVQSTPSDRGRKAGGV